MAFRLWIRAAEAVNCIWRWPIKSGPSGRLPRTSQSAANLIKSNPKRADCCIRQSRLSFHCIRNRDLHLVDAHKLRAVKNVYGHYATTYTNYCSFRIAESCALCDRVSVDGHFRPALPLELPSQVQERRRGVELRRPACAQLRSSLLRTTNLRAPVGHVRTTL